MKSLTNLTFPRYSSAFIMSGIYEGQPSP